MKLLACVVVVVAAFADARKQLPMKKEEFQKRIVGGSLSDVDRFPFTAFLEIDTVNGTFVCGGSLVSPSVVLTAGHCLDFEQINGVEVFMGCQDVARTGQCSSLAMAEFNTFPTFTSDALDGDYSVITLDGSFTDFEPVALAGAGLSLDAGLPVTVVGHGVTAVNADSISRQLLEVEVNIVDQDQCDDQYARISAIQNGGVNPANFAGGITDHMFCASAEGKDSCQGDSGGPIFLRCDDGSSPDVQVGVVSFGLGCAYSNIPGIYAKVPSQDFLDFLSDIVTAKGESLTIFDGSADDFCGASLTLAPEDLELFDPYEEWDCPGKYFATSDGCDCDCGSYDPDCEFFTSAEETFNCYEGQVCSPEAECIAGASTAATWAAVALIGLSFTAQLI